MSCLKAFNDRQSVLHLVDDTSRLRTDIIEKFQLPANEKLFTTAKVSVVLENGSYCSYGAELEHNGGRGANVERSSGLMNMLFPDEPGLSSPVRQMSRRPSPPKSCRTGVFTLFLFPVVSCVACLGSIRRIAHQSRYRGALVCTQVRQG